MLDMTKRMETRDGKEVRIYSTDGAGMHPIHGAYRDDDGWQSMRWTRQGDAFPGKHGPLDLVNRPGAPESLCFVCSVVEVYGGVIPQPEAGFEFVIENGQPAFRFVEVYEYFINEDGKVAQSPYIRLFAAPRLIVQKSS